MRTARILTTFILLGAACAATAAEPEASGEKLKQKLTAMIIPQIEFADASIEATLDFLRAKSRELDPSGAGVNIVCLGKGNDPEWKAISLALRDIPFSEALHYTAQLTGMRLTYEPHAVVLAPEDKNPIECEVTVNPVAEGNADPGQKAKKLYAVQFKLTKGSGIAISPRIQVPPGEEGVMVVGPEEKPFVRCTALVKEHPDGSASVHTTVKELDGERKVRFSVSHVIHLDKPCPDATRKRETDGLDADKPQPPEAIMDIQKDGKIRVEGQELRDGELATWVGTRLKKFPNQRFVLRAAEDVKYRDLVGVIDQCQRAGARDISFR